MAEHGKGSEKSHKVNILLYKPQKPGINTAPTIPLLPSTSVYPQPHADKTNPAYLLKTVFFEADDIQIKICP